MKKLLVLTFLIYSWKTMAFVPKIFHAEFEQKYKSKIGKKMKVSYGEMLYQAPQNIRIEILKPVKSTYIANSEKNWFYQPAAFEGAKGSVITNPTKGNKQLTTLFQVLRKGLKTNPDYAVSGEKRERNIAFTEKTGKDIGFKNVRFRFKDVQTLTMNNLESMIVTYIDGKEVFFRFMKLDLKPNVSAKSFVFKKPANVSELNTL